MQKKILFESARKALAEASLLIDASSPLASDRKGIPQNKSDSIQDSDIFIAIRGQQVDAHDLIPAALQKGAGLLVVENRLKLDAILKDHPGRLHWLLVKDTRAAWTVLSALTFDNPQQHLRFFGVTGTDGKTSTVWIASQLIRQHQQKCLSLGTLGAFDGSGHWPLDHTTPDPPVFFSALDTCIEKKIPNVVMEVSSHSLIQEKVRNLKFAGAVITSFSRDHLDFHKDMDDYWNAKSRLFESLLKDDGRAIINDRLFDKFSKSKLPTKDVWTYGFDPEEKIKRDFHVALLEYKATKNGQYIKFRSQGKTYEGTIPYLGMHNAENFIAAWLISESVLSFFPPPESWGLLSPIPGRCEQVSSSDSSPKVYVDFAHTPQGLKTILTTLREYTSGKLWVVFGCGGNRDRGKRPEMAAVAESIADNLLLTSDNPRNENPISILEDMKAGLTKNSDAILEVDRKKAIAFAIKHASPNDTVLIAGKGHESQQIIGDKKFPFSDQDTARQILKDIWS